MTLLLTAIMRSWLAYDMRKNESRFVMCDESTLRYTVTLPNSAFSSPANLVLGRDFFGSAGLGTATFRGVFGGVGASTFLEGSDVLLIAGGGMYVFSSAPDVVDGGGESLGIAGTPVGTVESFVVLLSLGASAPLSDASIAELLRIRSTNDIAALF